MNHYPRLRFVSEDETHDGKKMSTIEIRASRYFRWLEQVPSEDMGCEWVTSKLINSMHNFKIPSSSACACCGKLLMINAPFYNIGPAEYSRRHSFPSKFYLVYESRFIDSDCIDLWHSFVSAFVCSEECRKEILDKNNLKEEDLWQYGPSADSYQYFNQRD